MKDFLKLALIALFTSLSSFAFAVDSATEGFMLVKKQTFAVDSFQFEKSGRRIPVKIGYETYGKLNKEKSNAVLVCQYFTGHSHAAGKYRSEDKAPGWWDKLIGPGKTIDTNKFFVICSDTISNINFHNPDVITTGPASTNPLTGKPYAMDFPIFTLKDVVRLQRLLVKSMGINHLQFVIGPSMGGLQAFMWARHFPDEVGAIVSVFATPVMRPMGLMVPNQLGIDAIMMDKNWNDGNYDSAKPPRDGLILAFKILVTSTRTDHWANENFGRKLSQQENSKDPFKSFAGRFLVEDEIEKTVLARMQFFDANSYIYIAKANTLYDLREGNESYEEALARITMPVLMIIDESDLLFNMDQAKEAAKYLKNAEIHSYNSQNGHLSCLFETDYYSQKLGEFIAGF